MKIAVLLIEKMEKMVVAHLRMNETEKTEWVNKNPFGAKKADIDNDRETDRDRETHTGKGCGKNQL